MKREMNEEYWAHERKDKCLKMFNRKFRCNYRDNIKMDFKGMLCEDAHLINTALDRVQTQGILNLY
jgi:hypothetical protein